MDAVMREPGRPEGRAALVAAGAGREFEVFALLLARSANESREVGPVLGWAAARVGQVRRPGDLLSMARELQHRECCLRRSFLAASLEGLARGLADPPVATAVASETLARFAELSVHADAGVAAGAREVLVWLTPAGAEETPEAGSVIDPP